LLARGCTALRLTGTYPGCASPCALLLVETREVGKGKSFGELALLYNTPRAATVKVLEDATLWTLTRTIFRSIVIHFKQLRVKKYEDFLKKVPILESLSAREVSKIASALEESVYEVRAMHCALAAGSWGGARGVCL